MSTPLIFLTILIGSFLYLFIYWRRLKEDYASPLIFVSSIFQLVLLIFVYWFAKQFLAPSLSQSDLISPNGLWFWLDFGAISLSQLLLGKFTEMKYYEVFEATVLASFYLLLAFFISQLLLLGAGLILALIIFYYLLDHNYKKFAWYRSGKVGFSSLTTLAIFFLIRAIMAFLAPNSLLLFGKIDTIISSSAALITFASLYNLSQSRK